MTASASDWSVEELNEQLESGGDFFLLDVRNRDEFESAPIEGVKPVPTLNVPYFEMLESSESFDFVDSITEALDRGLLDDVPKDKRVLTVCAKGDTSEFVVQALAPKGYEIGHLDGGTLAWGNFYLIRTVTEAAGLSVYQVQRPQRGCLSYVVVSDGKAAIIDPLRHIDHYKEFAAEKGFEIELIVDTHGHADHISGGRALADELGVPYWLHPYDGIHPLDMLPAELEYEFMKDGWQASVGSATIRAIHIPGHTLGNIVYYVNDRFLFTGDSIFIRSIARPDLGGQGEAWAPIHFRSLASLMELPDETMILPGHFSGRDEENQDGLFVGELGRLKETNDGLQMVAKGQEAFVAFILGSLPKFPEEYIDIKRVNAGLLHPDEDEAMELELGKNICALSQAYQLVEG
jgi:glyoxylase-like metal-dependent hydrolase (beta-lactamase superfamily II)